MSDIYSFFREHQEAFTVYVVEQRFAVGRGFDYFKSFRGKENLIDTNGKIKKRIMSVLKWIQRNIPNVSELIEACFLGGPAMSIAEIITSLNKLFSVHEHQAVGPDVIDPIIIQEETISSKYVTQIISLHEKSILQPTIIILLKDDNFDRAKALFSKCPHGINIKMIRNSGESEIYKVINTGADTVDSFISAFSQHCFSTCSHTPRNILLNEEWSNNSLVKYYAPSILKNRTNLLYDEKEEVSDDIDIIIANLENHHSSRSDEESLIRSFECTTKLMRVFCHDCGSQDMQDAYKIAKELDNEILLAQVFRYSHFLNNHTIDMQKNLLERAENIFSQNRMEDQAIYCLNNRLVYQFQESRINTREFKTLQEKAVYNVPGLVGMSHILSNTGVAYLMTGKPEEAMEYFSKGLDYARSQERNVQKAAILCNMLIAKSYCYYEIPDNDFKRTLNFIFDTMGMQKLPFISVRLAMNVIAVAFKQNEQLGYELLSVYPIKELMEVGLRNNNMGSGELMLQMQYLNKRYEQFDIHFPELFKSNIYPVNGMHREYILRQGLNPFVFCTWL